MEPEKITFPADYPIKVVARSELKLRAEIDAIFERHFGALPPGAPAERPSAQGNFMALTYVMRGGTGGTTHARSTPTCRRCRA